MRAMHRTIAWSLFSVGLMTAVGVGCAESSEPDGFVEPVPEAGPTTDATVPPPQPDAARDAGRDAPADAASDADADVVGPVCGEGGFCFVADPSSAADPNETITLSDVKVAGSTTWACGYRTGGRGVIMQLQGDTWSIAWTGPGAITKITTSPEGEVWGFGYGRVVRGVGENGAFTWSEETIPIPSGVASVWVAGPGDAWATSTYDGVVHRLQDGSWVKSLVADPFNWQFPRFFGTVWGAANGELWATLAAGEYDFAEEYVKYDYSLIHRPAGGAPDGADADAGDDAGGPTLPDGWALVSGTTSAFVQYYQASVTSTGEQWLVGRDSSSNRTILARSQVVDGKVTFGAPVDAVDSSGAPLGGYISDMWASSTGAYALGTYGIYRTDGTTWSLVPTAINGLPLLALGTVSAIDGDSSKVVVLGDKFVLRLEVNP